MTWGLVAFAVNLQINIVSCQYVSMCDNDMHVLAS